MTRSTGRPRGRPPKPPREGEHDWQRATAEDGTQRRACERRGARFGAWLTADERAAYAVVDLPPLRGDARADCGAADVGSVTPTRPIARPGVTAGAEHPHPDSPRGDAL